MNRVLGEELFAFSSAAKRSTPTLLCGRTYIDRSFGPNRSAPFAPYFSDHTDYNARLVFWICYFPGKGKAPIWHFPLNRWDFDISLSYHRAFEPTVRLEEFQLSAVDRLGVRQRGPFVNNVRR